MHMDSKFADRLHLVLQITPEMSAGAVQIGERIYKRTAAWIYIPKSNVGSIFCPLNYFQQSASIPGKWILNNTGQRVILDGISSLNEVTVSELRNDSEIELEIPLNYQIRLYDYFNFDVSHNEAKYKGFDCYAFVSFIGDIKYFPQKPSFEYIKREPVLGEFIVLANSSSLPESIRHWALYLGKGYYLSKFGISGFGTESLLNVMDLDGMKYLYQAEDLYVAAPFTNSKSWEGFEFDERRTILP